MPEEIMPAQLSSLNTLILLRYLEKYHAYGGDDLEELVLAASQGCNNMVRDHENGEVVQIALRHLLDDTYWISNHFVIRMYEEIQKRIPDPELGYKIGLKATELQEVKNAALGVALLGLGYALGKIGDHMSKWNQTKEIEVVPVGKGHVQVRLEHIEGIRINKFAMDLHRGIFEAYGRLIGYPEISVEYAPHEFSGRDYLFDIRFRDLGLAERLAHYLQSKLPYVKQLKKEQATAIELADQAQLALGMTVRNLENAVSMAQAALQAALQEKSLLELNLELGNIIDEMFHVEANLWGTPTQALIDTGRDHLAAIGKLISSIGTESFGAAMKMYEKQALRFSRALNEVDAAVAFYDDVRQAIYHIIASNSPDRDIMLDIRYIQTLLNNQQAFRQANTYIVQPDFTIPDMTLQGRFQASLLEAAVNALNHGAAQNILFRVDSVYSCELDGVPIDATSGRYLAIHIYDDGVGVDLENLPKSDAIDHSGLHRANVRARLNGGFVRFEPVEPRYLAISGLSASPDSGERNLTFTTNLVFYLPYPAHG